MATIKYLSLDRLADYDSLLKTKIATDDAAILAQAKTDASNKDAVVLSEAQRGIDAVQLAVDTLSDNLQDALDGKANSSHTHDDRYYTESEIDSKLSGKADSTHNHDSAYDKKGAADTALASAKTYADNAAATVKNDLLNGAGTAYDTLKELGELIDDNKDAIEALETIASGKADATHTHAISDVTGLQSALDGKAASSHGTHVTYSTTAPVMDGTASVGTAATVARSDHKHPTDTSRASKADFDTHVADTTKHITSAERTNWGAAYSHSTSAHAPSNAEKNQNAFSNVKVGSTTVAADTTTDTLEIAAGTGISVAGDATNDKVTITNSGVIAVSTGSANGTISVNTNGTAVNVAVKGLGSAAYTNSSAYATTDRVADLEDKVGDGFEEITVAEIQALFA